MIELMVVVAITAILAALAAPSFTPIIERWRVRQSVEEMTSGLYFARSEAIKRGGGVVMVKLPNSGACSLAGTNEDWGCGWTVFADTNGNGTQNAGEPTLQTTPLPANTNIVLPSNGGKITVDRWGAFNGISATAVRLTPVGKTISDPASAAICVSSGGRIRTVAGSGIC
nr:GspH/FimT family protein [Acidovorax radicis]